MTVFPRLALALLAWSSFGTVAPGAHAQVADTSDTRIADVEADSGRVRIVDGREIYELLRPRLRDGDTTVRSERMTQQADRVYLFMGDVVIIDDTDTLTADRVLYDHAAKIGRATGNVRLGDGEVVVHAPEGDYDSRAKRADFRSGVRLVDSTSTLTSTTGTYWTETGLAEFAGDVRLVQDSLRMAADSMRYDRETRVAEAWAGVVIERRDSESDTTDVTWVMGERAVNDEESGRSNVWGDVVVLQTTADSTGAPPDSLWISAGRVGFVRSDPVDLVVAVDSVRIVRGSFAALADSVVYRVTRAAGSVERRESRLHGAPMAWVERAQISGDSLALIGNGRSPDTLTVVGSAFVALRDSATAPVHQLRGRRMTGLFEDDSLRVLEVHSNAEGLYYREAGPEREGGALRLSGDRVVLSLSGDEVTGINAYEGVEATWYPTPLVTDAVRLDGPGWQPDRRPDAEPLRLRYLVAHCRVRPERCPD